MATELIRIRFNTMHKQEGQNGLLWRILVGENILDAEERLASDLAINVPSWGSHDVLPSGEDKYHIACRGVPSWDGTRFVVDPA